MSSAHAKLGPSGADRWMQCTASVDLIDRLTEAGLVSENSTSVYAAEGTIAHEIREMCFVFGLEPSHFVGSIMSVDGFQFTVEDDMAENLQTGIDWIREHTQQPDVEIRVDLSRWLPEQFGTCDTGWIAKNILYVSDLKYGQGENVEAEGNRQIRLYALGYWVFKGRPEVEKIVLNIDQPRAGGMKFWEITLDELLDFGAEVRDAYTSIVTGETTFAPGSKACRWCPAKDLGCNARDSWMFDMIAEDIDSFDDDAVVVHPVITPELRWKIITHSTEIRAWLNKLNEDSLAAALDGKPDPGSKAVEGDYGNRTFTDEEQAEFILVGAIGDKAYKPRQIIGIPDIEKTLKPGKRKKGHPEAWADLLELVHQPLGKPKLVPESHPRLALSPIMDDYDDLDD